VKTGTALVLVGLGLVGLFLYATYGQSFGVEKIVPVGSTTTTVTSTSGTMTKTATATGVVGTGAKTTTMTTTSAGSTITSVKTTLATTVYWQSFTMSEGPHTYTQTFATTTVTGVVYYWDPYQYNLVPLQIPMLNAVIGVPADTIFFMEPWLLWALGIGIALLIISLMGRKKR